MFANYASTSSYRWVSYVMFTCWLSCSYRYTPYLTSYMCTRWLSFRWLPFSYRCISYICSLVDCRFPIYTSRILYSHLLIVVFLLMHPYAYAHSLIVVSHRCITYVYAQTLIVLYLQFLFQYPSINIDKWTCMHAKRNVLVMIRRIGGVSSCLCCANDIVVTEEPDDIRI